MSVLPNPFTDSGAYPTVSAPDETAASSRQVVDAAADISDIGEIFVGARKLDTIDAEYLFELDPGNDKFRGMPKPRLDVAAFMLELDEPPLFLQQVG